MVMVFVSSSCKSLCVLMVLRKCKKNESQDFKDFFSVMAFLETIKERGVWFFGFKFADKLLKCHLVVVPNRG